MEVLKGTSKLAEGLKGGSDKVETDALPQLKIIRFIVKVWYFLEMCLGILLLQIENGEQISKFVRGFVGLIAFIPMAGFVIYICFPKVTTLRDAPVGADASQDNKIHLLVPVAGSIAILGLVAIGNIKLYTYARFFYMAWDGSHTNCFILYLYQGVEVL